MEQSKVNEEFEALMQGEAPEVVEALVDEVVGAFASQADVAREAQAVVLARMLAGQVSVQYPGGLSDPGAFIRAALVVVDEWAEAGDPRYVQVRNDVELGWMVAGCLTIVFREFAERAFDRFGG